VTLASIPQDNRCCRARLPSQPRGEVGDDGERLANLLGDALHQQFLAVGRDAVEGQREN